MADRASLVATLTDAPEVADFDSLPPGVDWVEVRADLVGDVPASWFRDRCGARLLYTLRSRAEGGSFRGSQADRRKRLGVAAQSYDRVDLEADRDLQDALLAEVPPEKRLLSWHGPGREKSELAEIFDRMSQVDAELYKMVPMAGEACEEIAPLQLLAELGRRDVVAFSTGESGAWTRFVAPYLGAPVLFGAWGAEAGAPGQPSVKRIESDYPFPDLPPVECIYGIVGSPVTQSLSPRMHNASYREHGLPALYVPFGAASFADFWLEIVEGGVLPGVGLPIRGLSVTAPYKASAVAVAGALSPLAQRSDSVNTLVLRDGVWEGETTDPEGVRGALEAVGVALAGRRVAVLGCGGAGRSVAVGLANYGAEVTVANRSVEKGEKVAATLQLPFASLGDFDPHGYDVVVNATALGHEENDPLPFDPTGLRSGAAVVDMVYSTEPTPLLRAVRDLGHVGVDGREVLLHQALAQFPLMTGAQMSLETSRRLLGLPLSGELS